MYKGFYIILIVLMCGADILSGQGRPVKPFRDSSSIIDIPDSKQDSTIRLIQDSLPTDSISPINFDNVKLSDGGLDAEVDYGGDSTWYDAREKKYHLYGVSSVPAFVNYQDMELTAGYIIFDIENDIAEAYYRNKGGRNIEQPTFVKGENTFKYTELKFNFKTQKGIVTNAITQDGEFFLHGAKTKFISKDADSLMLDDEIYNENAMITTCNLDHPHWGIRSTKLKVVPNKLAILGLSNVEIAGIPTPLVLPFGFFPLVKGQSSGLIFPSDYEFDQDLGLGFREVGYYFPINDYVDLRMTGDIYTRGTYRIRANSTYVKKYAFSGTVRLGFSSNKIEDANTGQGLRNRAINIAISHNQDSKAHPFRKIGGTINIQTDNYQRNNFNDANSQLNNRLSSNFNFTHTMPGTPFSFRMGLAHDQNSTTRKVNITLPDIALNMNTIFPFRRKGGGGDKKWYEEISLKYDLQAKNRIQTTDTTLFSPETLENMQTGISHRASSSASFNLAKYFSFTPNVNYEELWYFASKQRVFDPSPVIERDTIVDGEGNLIARADTVDYGQVVEEIQRGFQPVRLFNMGVNMSTQIFGTARLSKGWLRGIRHTIKPSISFNYSPDSRTRYLETVDTDTRTEFNNPQEYNPYSNGALRSPSLSQQQMALNFSINNIFEGKYYSKKDSTEKNFKILNSLRISGGYNFAADSLKWSSISFNGNTKLFGLSRLVFNGSLSPYFYQDGRQTARTLWFEQKKILGFRRFQARLNTDFTFNEIRDLFRGDKKEEDSRKGVDNQEKKSPNREGSALGPGGFSQEDAETGDGTKREISILDLLQSFRLSHNLVYEIRKERDGGVSRKIRTNSITIRGSIPLTDKWQMRLGNISYDFVRKSLVYPSIGLSRDLHCWEMSFDWRPSNGVYSFYIGVKPGTFSFLKYNYGQNNAQNFFGNQGLGRTR